MIFQGLLFFILLGVDHLVLKRRRVRPSTDTALDQVICYLLPNHIAQTSLYVEVPRVQWFLFVVFQVLSHLCHLLTVF